VRAKARQAGVQPQDTEDWVSLDVEGTRRLERLEENLGAADVTLSADLSAIRAAADQITVVGELCPPPCSG
jgi:aryl-alcohol dehydrogenase-like predicted oxidoreductase